METLLTVPQAAVDLGVSQSRVWQLIAERRLKAVDRYGRKLIRPRDLDAVRARKRTGRPKKSPGKF